ncbi:MAG: oxygenase MpaB family protein [Gordonia sp. (in: high G+C Gram-positive bacteria)]|uniref:oxygenase MpaB family protein n=1 Tax=Gordonia sp. (in: high G+C Gram-positive bacteria) TaxID=84139 RepID=UPI003BB4C65C
MPETAPLIPRRHPDSRRPIPAGVALIGRLLGIRGPDDARFARLGELLMAGDPDMDQFAEWMSGRQDVRPLFEQALATGIDSVEHAPTELKELFARLENTPDWVDHAQLEIAAAAMRSGGSDGLAIARDVALLGGYQFAGFNQTLLRTGALEKGSTARFAETSEWAMDVISPGGLDLFGAGYRSTIRVRFIHSMVRRHVAAMHDWDPAEWGLPINQTDMAATIVGSLVAPTLGGASMGLINRPHEYRAVAHLTRYVGWLMGIDDELLPTDFRDCVRLLTHTSAALATPDETSKRLAKPMADDPLQWHYARFAPMRRRLSRSKHLSISVALLGRRAMARLGLPTGTIPWYPVLVFPRNLVWSVIGLHPRGRQVTARLGDRDARAFLAVMTEAPATIGASTTVADHVA